MTILQLGLMIAVTLAAAVIRRGRSWLLMAASIFAVYLLQPALPVRQLDFWVPFATLALVTLTWLATQHADLRAHMRENLSALAMLVLIPLAIGMAQYFAPLSDLLPSIPPNPAIILIGAAILIAFGLALYGISVRAPARRGWWIAAGGIFLLIGILIILKNDSLAIRLAAFLRVLNGQTAALASPLDIRWLGFSYLAFRLIHVLRDRMTGRLPDCTLKEFVIYAVFFPAFLSGPIDRMERFREDLRRPYAVSSAALFTGGRRIVWGMFKKFSVADFLALFALNATNAALITGAGWMWVALYAYAFRIFFDFSGYTDIAIGLGNWVGFSLPENFQRPYTQPNLTAFWNSWHITLAQWFRAYFFNPLTRAMRSRWRTLSVPLIIFLGQTATMALIGLWHGITWNFLAWGLWHGFGLFAHSRWTEATREWKPPASPITARIRKWGGAFLTFQFVAIGWAWFALPSMGLSLRVIAKLFGA
jgi:alginate O-acetyltransferase complex protein AlgI